MTRVRKVEIDELAEGSSDVKKMLTSLSELENLEYLLLRGFRFRSMPSLDDLAILHSRTNLKLEGLLPTLPRVTTFPPNISRLTLSNTSLDRDPMPELAKLPNLARLKLRNAYAVAIPKDGFPKLRALCIGELWHLRNVRLGEGAMPELKRLEISHCP